MKLTQDLSNTLDLQLQIDTRLALKEQIEQLEAERKEIDASIQAELHARGVETLIVGEHKLSIVTIDGRVTIDRMKLLENGVTTGQIKAAENVGDPYSRLDVRKAPKGKR